MNILLINHYAGSLRHGMVYRSYYLAREWARAGHAVRILAAGYSHVRRIQPSENGAPIVRRTTERLDGIEYVWYPTPAYEGNQMGRARNIWAFLRQVWRDSGRLVAEARPEVVIAASTYPMDIWVGRRIARSAGAKLIYEVRDLWPLTLVELHGMSPGHPFVRLCQWAENSAYRHADAVVSKLPAVRAHMAAHGLDLRKLHIVPCGVAPEEWQAPGQPIDGDLADYARAAHQQGNLLVGYGGAHGFANALDVLLDAAKLLKEQPMRFVLVGDGQERARLQRRLEDEGLENVRMFASVPKARIPALFREFDIAYIGWRRKPIYRFGIAPNKLMDYMMAGCAILHSVEAGNDTVAEAGCGLSVPPESPQAVADGLSRLAALTAAERARLGSKGRAYVEMNHAYPVLARKFLSAVA